jgi:hypothetical protein
MLATEVKGLLFTCWTAGVALIIRCNAGIRSIVNDEEAVRGVAGLQLSQHATCAGVCFPRRTTSDIASMAELRFTAAVLAVDLCNDAACLHAPSRMSSNSLAACCEAYSLASSNDCRCCDPLGPCSKLHTTAGRSIAACSLAQQQGQTVCTGLRDLDSQVRHRHRTLFQSLSTFVRSGL